MNEITRLILSIEQINNVISLTQDNEYEDYIKGQLIPASIELQRQLNLLTKTNVYSKIKESN